MVIPTEINIFLWWRWSTFSNVWKRAAMLINTSYSVVVVTISYMSWNRNSYGQSSTHTCNRIDLLKQSGTANAGKRDYYIMFFTFYKIFWLQRHIYNRLMFSNGDSLKNYYHFNQQSLSDWKFGFRNCDTYNVDHWHLTCRHQAHPLTPKTCRPTDFAFFFVVL